MREQFLVGEEHPHLVPCNTARQGHGSRGDFCRKQTSTPETWEKQGARSAGKQGRSWATAEHRSQLLPSKGESSQAPPSWQKVQKTSQKRSSHQCLGHSDFARKGLEKRNKTWYFAHAARQLRRRTQGRSMGRQGDCRHSPGSALRRANSLCKRTSSWMSPGAHPLLQRACSGRYSWRGGNSSCPPSSQGYQKDTCYQSVRRHRCVRGIKWSLLVGNSDPNLEAVGSGELGAVTSRDDTKAPAFLTEP